MFCTRARAHVRALMMQKSCAVGMRNAKPGNHLSLHQAKSTLTTHNANRHCRVRFYTLVEEPLSK